MHPHRLNYKHTAQTDSFLKRLYKLSTQKKIIEIKLLNLSNTEVDCYQLDYSIQNYSTSVNSSIHPLEVSGK